MRDQNRRKRAAGVPKLKSWINQENSQTAAAVPGLHLPLPVQMGSDLQITQLAYDMPPYALDLVFKCEFGL